jgi:hypothetical protein
VEKTDVNLKKKKEDASEKSYFDINHDLPQAERSFESRFSCFFFLCKDQKIVEILAF